ncbi:transcriptional regulator [Alkalicoccobacillus porphyridii]|uniref:Transcriptional regulator n=1 Tax=Alkalicoccobacillus porphyridii TaxID=2597270 RepID=A0A554A094_9BACI|nr:transcriptional regulator [Alkalicoccobacillus porphyridii]TSB47111.1 transcriptional regulator [Alkalicoccobacillus porphyridii]
MSLTTKQEKVLMAIKSFINENNLPPTSRELCVILGIKSSSTVHGHFVRLKDKGYIDWEEAKPRTMKVLKGA